MTIALPSSLKPRLEERCLPFGIAVAQLARRVSPNFSRRSKEQLISCATAVGANVAEACSAQSRNDFISKFEIALKEARETDYWLRFLKAVEPELTDQISQLIEECWEITAILVASVKTAKSNGGIVEPRLRTRNQNLE